MAGRREREAILKTEAAAQLAKDRGGGFAGITVTHACGEVDALEVTFRRSDDRFFARLLHGEIVELEAYRRKAKA